VGKLEVGFSLFWSFLFVSPFLPGTLGSVEDDINWKEIITNATNLLRYLTWKADVLTLFLKL